MENVMVRALSLSLIIVLGYIIKRIGWVSKDNISIFSNIVLKITLPCSIITSFNEVNVEASMLKYSLIGLLINLILGLAGYLIGKKEGVREQAFNILNYGSFNIGAFSLPFISTFIGARGVVTVSMFDLGNSFGVAGANYSIAKNLTDKSGKISLKKIVISMFSSVLFVTYLVMAIIRLLGITLPYQVITFTSIVGESNTFLAMLMIGIAFELNLDLSKVRKSFKGLGVRYIVCAIVSLIIYFVLPFNLEDKKILIIILFSPIAVMVTGFTKEMDLDLERSSFMSSTSMVLGIIIITILLGIL